MTAPFQLSARVAEWPRLARDIVATPEDVLARFQAPFTRELEFDCIHSLYWKGNCFIELLQARATTGETPLLNELLALLRAAILADSRKPLTEPVLDARGVLPFRRPLQKARAE